PTGATGAQTRFAESSGGSLSDRSRRAPAERELMKAAVYSGGDVQIQDVVKPVPKDDEVLVRVHTSTICAADYRLKSFPRVFAMLIGLRKGKILGMELSGTVESVGKSVTRFRSGD